MSGGYRPLPEDDLARLVQDIDKIKSAVRQLQMPTGTQFRPPPVTADGGFASGAAITGNTGVVWVSNSGFASVTVDIPATASGDVLVYVTATIEVNIFGGASTAGNMTAYVSHTAAGGTVGSETDALVVGSSVGINDTTNISLRSTAVNRVTLSPGQAHTLRLCAAYKHTGTASGLYNINDMAIAAQVLS